MSKHGSTRRGTSLIEMIVAVAVVIILAAALVPTLTASADRARVERAAVLIEDLMDAMTTMRFDNQDWPSRLSHLAFPITTADQNACGNNYNPGRVNNWDGPYISRPIPATGLPVGIGTARDQFDRVVLSGGGGGQIAHLKLIIEGVTIEDALELERLVDGDSDPAGGTIRWSAPDASGMTTVEWVRTTKGC